MVDPTCAFHGKKWSEHEGGRCLYCPLCFRSDYGYPHWVDEDGQKWDVCQECGETEALAPVSPSEPVPQQTEEGTA